MNSIELMKELGMMGMRYRPSDVTPAINYFDKMINDGRVISIKREGVPYLIVTFSVTNDFKPYINKSFWEYKEHDVNGKIIYFEKLFSRGWDKELRSMIKEIISNLYPRFEQAVWHRDASWGDRQVTIKRRLQYV